MDESLSAAAITDGLGTHSLGRRVIYVPQVASTNDVAKQLAVAGEPEGTLVITDEQTAGRGRMARTWIAPPRSSILMSLVLRPPLEPGQLARVTMAVALGTCDGIRATTQLPVQLKWPNDVLVGEAKCAGILAEADLVEDRVQFVIVGLGLNVNFNARSVAGIPPNATTLATELGRSFPRAALVQSVLEAIEPYYDRVTAGESLHTEWAARLATLNRRVHVRAPWGEETGWAESVDADGALLLRRPDGSLVRLIAGDVTLKD